MDIVLEVVDHYFADWAYASLLPISSSPSDYSHGNSTLAMSAPMTSTGSWEYTPSTHLFYLEPTQAAYESAWPRDNVLRQALTLFLVTWVFGLINYFVLSTLSYIFIFDKSTFAHPKFLHHQIRQEIRQAALAMPGMAIPTTALFVLEVRGYTRLYDSTEQGPGFWYDVAQPLLFLLFTDFCIYWIHRWLHLPGVYKHLHKRHHRWIVPSPFASYAFHPLDGFAQSVPYHLYPVLFPMHKFLFLGGFIFVNAWTILIHDGEYIANNPVINGSACHTAHHLFFNYNYGQFTTIWDRIGGSYRKPDAAWFNKTTKMSQETWESGVKEMEKMQRQVEGKDDRTYGTKKNI